MTAQHLVSAPVTTLKGDIIVPGDKSISHRAILLGAIATGETVVDGFLEGEDCLATIHACRLMGVRIQRPAPQQVVIQGKGKYGLKKPPQPIDCGNSGTSIRLLSGLLVAQSFDSQLIGDASLSSRPMNRVAHPLRQMGAKIETTAGCPPIDVTASQGLQGITYHMPQASAQVKSCLLLAGMYASGDTTVIEPQITRDHTERMLTFMGHPVRRSGHALTINAIHDVQGCHLNIPGDLSSAAFFIIAATIIPDAFLTIRNVGINPTRTGVLELLNRMGANIHLINERQYGDEPVADIVIQHAVLRSIDIPKDVVSLTIDEFPILFIAAACAEGTTILHGAEELRCKESDRIAAMADGLNRLGIDTQATPDGIVIHGGQLRGGVVDSYGDHRIAMAFAIAGAVATAPVMIRDCDAISTSFPEFEQTATQCGFQISRNFRS